MSIQMVKVRAKIEVGGVSISTPYIQSFNVNKQRGQVSTFNASLKVRASDAESFVGDMVRIYAGENTAKLIFTGICRQAKISPCFDEPEFFILSISGADVLSLLMGKKYTRRCRATKASWTEITGVVRPGLRSGKFQYNKGAILVEGTADMKDSARTGSVNLPPRTNTDNHETKSAPQLFVTGINGN